MELSKHLQDLRNNICRISGQDYYLLTDEDKLFLNSAARFEHEKDQNGGKCVAHFIDKQTLELALKKNPLLRICEFEQAFSLEFYLSNSDFTYLYHNCKEKWTPARIADVMNNDGRLSMYVLTSEGMMDKFIEMFA